MNARILVPLMCFALLAACAPSNDPVGSTTPVAAVPGSNPGVAPATAADGDSCALTAGASWATCVGKRVQIRGKQPVMLMQHPMLVTPALPGAVASTQSYVETAEGLQVIVLTENGQSPCAGAMRVEGTLKAINLGGAQGTPMSYRGWAVQGATVTCE